MSVKWLSVRQTSLQWLWSKYVAKQTLQNVFHLCFMKFSSTILFASQLLLLWQLLNKVPGNGLLHCLLTSSVGAVCVNWICTIFFSSGWYLGGNLVHPPCGPHVWLTSAQKKEEHKEWKCFFFFFMWILAMLILCDWSCKWKPRTLHSLHFWNIVCFTSGHIHVVLLH